jgi:hypothetical protein
MASCQCGKDPEKEANLTLQVNKVLLEGTDTSVEVFIKNQSDATDKAAVVAQFKLRATIIEQITEAGNQGTGSDFNYTTAEGQQVTEPSIDTELDHLITNVALSPQHTEVIKLTIIPGPDVSQITTRLELFDVVHEKIIGEETVKWTKKSPSQQLHLSLANVIAPIGNQEGSFSIIVDQGEVNSKDITVVWSSGSDNAATFKVAGKSVDSVTLADLLPTSDLIKPGTTVGPIPLQLVDSKSQSAATITLNFKSGNLNVGTGIVPWSAKDIQLALTLQYDRTKKKVTYTVTNKGQDKVDKNDHLKLLYQTADGVNLANKEQDTLEIQKLKANGGTQTNQLDLNLQGKLSTEVTFTLMRGDNPVGKPEVLICAQEEVKLKFADSSPLRLGGSPKATITASLTLQNDGQDLAIKDKIKVKIKKKTGPKVTINNKLMAVEDSIDVEAIAAVAGGKTIEAVKLTLDPHNETEAQFELELYYGGQPTGSTKRIIWEKAEVQLNFVDSSLVELKGSNLTISYAIKNSGTAKANPNKIALQITKLAGSKKVTIGGVQLAVGNEKTIKLPTTEVGLDPGATLKALSLSVVAKDGNRTTEFMLQLVYDGMQIGDPKKIIWVPDVTLDFVDSSELNLAGKDTEMKVLYKIINTGHNIACKAGLQIQVTNNSKHRIEFGGTIVKVGQAVFIAGNTIGGQKLERNQSREVTINLNALKNSEVELELRLAYDQVLMGASKKIVWKKAPKFGIKVLPQVATAINILCLEIELSNRSRDLSKDEVASLVLACKLPNDPELKFNGQSVVGKTLAELGLAKELKKNDGIKLTLKWSRKANVKKILYDLGLKDSTGSIELGNKIKLIEWPALPKITLTTPKKSGIKLNNGVNSLTLKLVSDEKVTPDQLKAIKLNYNTDGGVDGSLEFDNVDINTLTLSDLLKGSSLDKKKEIKLNLDKFNATSGATGVTKITIILTGLVESIPLVVEKTGK